MIRKTIQCEMCDGRISENESCIVAIHAREIPGTKSREGSRLTMFETRFHEACYFRQLSQGISPEAMKNIRRLIGAE